MLRFVRSDGLSKFAHATRRSGNLLAGCLALHQDFDPLNAPLTKISPNFVRLFMFLMEINKVPVNRFILSHTPIKLSLDESPGKLLAACDNL